MQATAARNEEALQEARREAQQIIANAREASESMLNRAREDAGRQADAQTASVAGGRADIVNVVTAVAESEAAIETLVAVRDRVIAAYEEIMRMPV